MEMLPGNGLQVTIFVTRFKQITEKAAAPPSPKPRLGRLPHGMDSAETIYPPTTGHGRRNKKHRSSSVSSVDSVETATDKYIDLTEYNHEYGDEIHPRRGDSESRDNYILDLTNFDGDNDGALSGEDSFNRRVMKSGKARRAKTRKAMKPEHIRHQPSHSTMGDHREPSTRWSRHPYGAAGGIGAGESDGLLSSPFEDPHPEEPRTAASSVISIDIDSGTLTPGSSRPTSPGSHSRKPSNSSPPFKPNREMSDRLEVEEPVYDRSASPFANLDHSSIRNLVGEDSGQPGVRLEVDEMEMRDVSIVSEHARAGQPKLDRIIHDEVELSHGSVIIACESPTF